MATKIVSGGGNIKVSAYNPDERKNKYAAESDRALNELAKQRAALQGNRTYASQYAQAINDYVNRGKFSYDFNADPIYNQYKDSYTRQGKLAMRDTMGQAAALTGGYGNSYAQTAGQQVYNNYMQQLNDVVPQLNELAYARYTQEGNDLLNKANALGEADSNEYQRLLQNYSIAADEFNTASALERNFASDALAREQLEYQKERDKVSDAQWEKQYALSLLSLGGSSSPKAKDETTDSLYNYKYKDEDGKTYFTNPEGKEEAIETGVNPYTRSKNSDIKYGTFSNGYQPDNVGGKKLTKSGYTDVVNGRTQNVWFDSDGYAWIWDGTKNAYQAYYRSDTGERLTAGTL